MRISMLHVAVGLALVTSFGIGYSVRENWNRPQGNPNIIPPKGSEHIVLPTHSVSVREIQPGLLGDNTTSLFPRNELEADLVYGSDEPKSSFSKTKKPSSAEPKLSPASKEVE